MTKIEASGHAITYQNDTRSIVSSFRKARRCARSGATNVAFCAAFYLRYGSFLKETDQRLCGMIKAESFAKAFSSRAS